MVLQHTKQKHLTCRHWQAPVSMSKINVSGEKKEESRKPILSLHGQTRPILDAVLSSMNEPVEETYFMNDENCKKKVEENRKRFVPIIEIVILLER